MQITANNISIHYELSGSGPCITLIHGAQDNLGVWWNQVPLFEKQYTVLTYDWRGHGETETPDTEYSYHIMVEDLRALLASLSIEKTYLLGHSMGCGIALRMAAQHPQMISALVLANGVGMAGKKGGTQLGADQPDPGREARWDELERNGLWPYPDDMELDETMRRYKQVRLKNDPAKYVKMIRSIRSPHRDVPAPDLGWLRCPVLLIAGRDDKLVPLARAENNLGIIPRSTLVVLPCGHRSPIEVPQQFNKAVLDFLANT